LNYLRTKFPDSEYFKRPRVLTSYTQKCVFITYVFISSFATLLEATIILGCTDLILGDSVPNNLSKQLDISELLTPDVGQYRFLILSGYVLLIHILNAVLIFALVRSVVDHERVSFLKQYFSRSRFHIPRDPVRSVEFYTQSVTRFGSSVIARTRVGGGVVSFGVILGVGLWLDPSRLVGALIVCLIFVALYAPLRFVTRRTARTFQAEEFEHLDIAFDRFANLEEIFVTQTNLEVEHEVVEQAKRSNRKFGVLKALQRFGATSLRTLILFFGAFVAVTAQNLSVADRASLAATFALLLRGIAALQDISIGLQAITEENEFIAMRPVTAHSDSGIALSTRQELARSVGPKDSESDSHKNEFAVMSWHSLVLAHRGLNQETSGRILAGHCLLVDGVSGSGKSSLLRVLAGIDLPTSGEVKLGRIPISKESAQSPSLNIGYLGQRNRVIAGSVRANVAFFRDVSDSQIEVALQQVGLHEAVMQRYSGLETPLSGMSHSGFSGGEIQRILFARVIVVKPTVLILDEPTSALDDISRDHIYGLIKDLLKSGIAVILASHDEVFRSLANEVISMEDLK